MKFLRSFFLNLSATDMCVVVFYVLLSAANIIFHSRLQQWYLLVIMNIGVISFVLALAYLDKNSRSRFWMYVHYWYIAPIILLTFKEIYLMIQPLRPGEFDHILIAADRFIFGFDPTVALYKIANPLLTELLQIVYGSFYFLPMILGVNLMVKRRIIELDYSVFCVVYGFFLSYLGYFIFPAVGPRFTLHDFANVNTELPGLFLTNFLREVVNTGESIPSGTPDPISVVQRDVFPSGHTQMTIITMYLAYKLKVRSRYFLIPTGILLIFATVYLRYHYVIDLIGGFVFFVFTMLTAKYIFNFWQKKVGQEEFQYIEIKVPTEQIVCNE